MNITIPASNGIKSTVTQVMGEFETDVTVHSKTRVASRILSFELAEVGGHDLPAWKPGAHIDLILADGLARQYSLCGDVADRSRWRIAVLRDDNPRDPSGSHRLHDSIQVGDQLRVRGPRNHFSFEPARSHLFVAGGIGITPILPMVHAAHRSGLDWRLAYGARNYAEMAFTEELSDFGSQVTFMPQDNAGLIDVPGLLAAAAPGTVVHCCGPAPLLDAVRKEAALRDDISLRTERFSAPANTAGVDRAFEVVLAKSGDTVQVAADQSILHAIEATGRRLLSSCQAGMCGTCETAVLGGLPEHRDDVLTAAEQDAGDTMMICVSRCVGDRLILDL